MTEVIRSGYERIAIASKVNKSDDVTPQPDQITPLPPWSASQPEDSRLVFAQDSWDGRLRPTNVWG